jgi:hypothetical protein
VNQPVEVSKSTLQSPEVPIDLSKPVFSLNKGKKKWSFKTNLPDNAVNEQDKVSDVDKDADKADPKKVFNFHKMAEESKSLEQEDNQSVELKNEVKQVFNFNKPNELNEVNNKKEDVLDLREDEIQMTEEQTNNKPIDVNPYNLGNEASVAEIEKEKKRKFNFNQMNVEEEQNVESKEEPDPLDMLFNNEPAKNLLLESSEPNKGDNGKNEWMSKRQDKVDILEFLADDEVDQKSKEENVKHNNLIDDLEEIDMS